MTFKKAVKKTPHLLDSWRPGLEALRAKDRTHIVAEETRNLVGSVDVDTALQRIEPNANRWDFAIGYKHANLKSDFIYWVETHTGSDEEIAVVLRKMAWLKGWLRGDGHLLDKFEREIVWVPSSATSFTKGSTQVKTLATQGLRYSGSRLRIPDMHPDPAVNTRRKGRH